MKMVETLEILGLTGRNLKSISLVLITVSAFTGGNLWLNKDAPPLGYERYSEYGFSIEYREDMIVSTQDFGGRAITNKSGGLQGTLESESLEQFGVFWITPDMLPSHMHGRNPKTALDFLFGIAALSGTQLTDRGELKTSKKDGHEILYQYFNITESGITIQGIIGAWYCDEDDRIFMLYLVHVPDLNQPDVLSQDLVQKWQWYLDSLVCHD